MSNDYKIIACIKGLSLPERQSTKEEVDSTDNAEDAEYLMKEYAIAFGDTYSVWVEDEAGNRISDAPSAHARMRHLRNGKEDE